jgi:DNA-binding response OmpR family regulator
MNKGLAFVIEDDSDLVTIFSEALRRAGFEVEGIRAGDRAMERLAAVLPRIIVLDLHLPKVSGPDILRYIRSEERFKDTRVIITSADAQLADEFRDIADLVLVKPVSFSQLRDLAGRLLTTDK